MPAVGCSKVAAIINVLLTAEVFQGIVRFGAAAAVTALITIFSPNSIPLVSTMPMAARNFWNLEMSRYFVNTSLKLSSVPILFT